MVKEKGDEDQIKQLKAQIYGQRLQEIEAQIEIDYNQRLRSNAEAELIEKTELIAQLHEQIKAEKQKVTELTRQLECVHVAEVVGGKEVDSSGRLWSN